MSSSRLFDVSKRMREVCFQQVALKSESWPSILHFLEMRPTDWILTADSGLGSGVSISINSALPCRGG